MRRSLLFIPGNSPAMLQNADVFNADSVIIDVEDAISNKEKDSARYLVFQFLNDLPNLEVEIMVRINGFDTEFYDADITMLTHPKVRAFVLPKATSKQIEQMDKILTLLEKERKIHRKIGIVPIIESAISVLEMEEIAKSPRVCGLLLGGEDLTSDLGVNRTKEGHELDYARGKMAMVCKAYKIDAIDTPYTFTGDDAGLSKDASKVKRLGFTAKSCIHPNQVEKINQVFSPNEKEINKAMKILLAYEQSDGGVFSLDGEMIDEPIIKRAKTLIARAERFHLL
jgi:citrate lyase subunit beta/citryl-CoA lyase